MTPKNIVIYLCPPTLEQNNAFRVRQEICSQISAPHRLLVVDLSATEHCDASGLSVLLSAKKTASQFKGEVVLVSPNPALREHLEITGLTQFFAIYDRPEFARAHAQGIAAA